MRNQITYVANAGVFVELNQKKILIDGLCNSNLPIYKNPPAELRERLIQGDYPFADIDLLLFTHHHSDHFDPVSAARLLAHHPRAVALSTPAVINQLAQQPGVNPDRLITADPATGSLQNFEINGITLRSISLRHDGKEYWNLPHLAFLIGKADKNLLHVGDAKPSFENFNSLNWSDYQLDLLLAPFPYLGLPVGRAIIQGLIQPRKIAAIHFPVRELDRFGWIKGTLKNFERFKEDLAETVFLEEIGTSLIF